ncbi:MAG: DCC1-like thiol-disulfide oxidoreductase family protein [Methylococcaceae bacterium]|nr:DCC1-like thiol-disulfide oxidoreductase family protein [Methylococcaceae bacterium]
MIRLLRTGLQQGLEKQVPATGLGVFRILVGLVILQEVLFLLYFGHLIFDRAPFIEQASPVVDLFLALWVVLALCLTLGYHTRFAALANYLLWIVFVGFTPMWLDFDGGFDQMMTGIGFLLVFLPTERGLSLDNLRLKLKYSAPGWDYRPPESVSVLCYYLPLAMVLGLLYLDAGIHKLSAEFWRNGMGSWLPPSHPYYMSALDMSWLLNHKTVEQVIGYTLIVFQFLFLPLFWFKRCRVPLLLIGVSFHVGIILSLNIYQFGFGMLAPYALLVPFSWWKCLASMLRRKSPALTVFYDGLCPLCKRTVIVLSHFDLAGAVDFKDLQTHAKTCRQLDPIPEAELLKDLYALDLKHRLYSGVDTYIRILSAMIYPAPLAWIVGLPGIHSLAELVYRRIADNRARLSCDESCAALAIDPQEDPFRQIHAQWLGTPRRQATRIAKLTVLVILLQLNSTLQFGVFYRLNEGHASSEAGQLLEGLSNAVLFISHTFLGITPHALYMHDHFAGYEHILAVAYRDKDGQERFLPFVNEEGRIVAPNWGRIQCWWANIAVTPHIKRKRLNKALMQLTAFWGTKVGVDLLNTEFLLKMKEVRVPMDWEANLRDHNLRQPWRDIGTVRWDELGQVRVETPGIDLEAW